MLRALIILFLACGPALAQLQTAVQISGGSLPAGVLVLTFDDGPDQNAIFSGNQTLNIANLLNSQPNPIVGTFFLNPCHFKGADTPIVQSANCRPPYYGDMPPGLIDSMLALHQAIGNHGENHVSGTLLSDAGIVYEIRRAQTLLGKYQKGLHMVRPAGFAWNARIADVLNSDPDTRGLTGPFYADFIGSGYVNGQWVQADWDCFGRGFDAKTCGDLYLTAIRQSVHGGIILIHDRSPLMLGSDKVTAMVQYLLNQLKDFTFLPLEAALSGRKVETVAQQTIEFGSGDGFGDVVFGNITGNYKATPCKMRAGGVWCMEYDHHGFKKPKRWFVLSRQGGLRPGSQFWLADLEGSGKAGLVWEESQGIMYAASDGAGAFQNPRLVLPYPAAHGWRLSPGYSFHFGHFDRSGFEGLLVRGWFGLQLYTSDGTGLTLRTSGAQFADSQGWAQPQYPVRTGDIDGDGVDDVCGRSETGVLCSLITAGGIGAAAVWTGNSGSFADGDGWGSDPSAYSSFVIADIFGQGKKVPAGRKGPAVLFTGSDGSRFLDYRQLVDNLPPEWQTAPVYFADIDGDGQAEPVWMLPGGLFAGLTQIVLQVPGPNSLLQ